MKNDYLLIKLIDEYNIEISELKDMEKNILLYKVGTLFVQQKADSFYYYRKYKEGGKTKSEYLGKNFNTLEVQQIKTEFRNHKTLKKRIKETKKCIAQLLKEIKKYGGEKYGY